MGNHKEGSLSALLMTTVTTPTFDDSSLYSGPPSPSTNFGRSTYFLPIMALSLSLCLCTLRSCGVGDWFYFKNEHGAKEQQLLPANLLVLDVFCYWLLAMSLTYSMHPVTTLVSFDANVVYIEGVVCAL